MHVTFYNFFDNTILESPESDSEVECVEWIFDQLEVGGLYRDDPEFPSLLECIQSTNEIDPDCYLLELFP